MSCSRDSRGCIVIGSQCNVNTIQPSCLHSQVDITQNPRSPLSQTIRRKRRTTGLWVLMRLVHLLWFVNAPWLKIVKKKKIHQKRDPYSYPGREVSWCWLMIRSAWSNRGDRMLMPNVNTARVIQANFKDLLIWTDSCKLMNSIGLLTLPYSQFMFIFTICGNANGHIKSSINQSINQSINTNKK